MAYYTTMEEQYQDGEKLELSFRNLHTYAKVENKVSEESLIVPFGSLLNKYRHFMKGIIEEVPLSHEEYLKYRFSPKKLSKDLYGTTEYWGSLLEINHCKSIVDFDKETVYVYNPQDLPAMVNEILILEEVLK